MTEPSSSRPAPGPVRPAPRTAGTGPGIPSAPAAGDERFAGLDDRPVAEHVDVFEAEHHRLRAELGTIDQV